MTLSQVGGHGVGGDTHRGGNRDCGADLVLMHMETSFDLPNEEASRDRSQPQAVVLDWTAASLEPYPQTNLDLEIAPQATAYGIYTSGSTGQPKGVCVSHQAFAEHVVCIRQPYRLVAEDRVLQFSSYSFDPSLEQMFAPWSVGATVVLRGKKLWSPEEFHPPTCGSLNSEGARGTSEL